MDKTKTYLYGASDDLIEIGGAVEEEFGAWKFDGFLACSDGTLLELNYNGTWNLRCLSKGTQFLGIEPNVGDDGQHQGEFADATPYSDVAHFKGKLVWVVKSDDKNAMLNGKNLSYKN